MTTADIRTLVTRLAVMKTPVDLVVVDHLHHLADPLQRAETPRYQQIGHMVGALKALAKQHGCVGLVLAQLNRDADGRAPTSLSSWVASSLPVTNHLSPGVSQRHEQIQCLCASRASRHESAGCRGSLTLSRTPL